VHQRADGIVGDQQGVQFLDHADRLDAARRQQELIEALSVYHQLRGTPGQADAFGDRV
jgi:hypothetical protein